MASTETAGSERNREKNERKSNGIIKKEIWEKGKEGKKDRKKERKKRRNPFNPIRNKHCKHPRCYLNSLFK